MVRNAQSDTSDTQTVMNNAVRAVDRVYSGDSGKVAEVHVGLADAHARLHAAKQAEIANLLQIVTSGAFSGSASEKAAEKALELLGLS